MMMRLALVTLAALRCRAAAPQSRWRPYLDAGTPIKPSQCVLRFVNVPASAVDANAPPSADVYAKWRGDGEVVIVTGRTYPLLQVAVNAGLAFPRGKLKAPYHQDTMADCCLLELEDPDWLDPQHPMYDFMLEQGGHRGRRPVRACDTRVEPPPGCDEMVLDFAIQADVLASGFADPVSRFEGDWEAEFVGGSGGGRQYQKRRPGGRLPPAGEAGFDSTCGVAPWDAVQD